MRNGSLWSDKVFKKEERIFNKFYFETSDLVFWGLKISIWKHTTSCDTEVFTFIIISQLWPPIELKFSQVYYFMHMLRYTRWEDWSLTIILPIVSSVFNYLLKAVLIKILEVLSKTKAVSETATLATATARSRASAYSSTLLDALI